MSETGGEGNKTSGEEGKVGKTPEVAQTSKEEQIVELAKNVSLEGKQPASQAAAEHETEQKPRHKRTGEEISAGQSGLSRPDVTTGQQTPEVTPSASSDSERPRQVIAVSASKGPAAFFNLARKFLVTDEMVDLSALEGAIVSAIDAAHLLERSKLATIVR
jgi:hypothetical protein